MRRACLLLLTLPFLFQPTLRGQDAAKLTERLHAADAGSALDAPDVKPWYLKMTVQLFDQKGKPGEQGTVEEWWGGVDNNKRVYTLPSYTATFVRADGKMFHSPGAGRPPEMLEVLLREATHPMPSESEVEHAKPQMRTLKFGDMPLDCIMLAQPIEGLKSAPMGLFPTYCLDPGKESLRVTFNFGTQLVRRNAMGTFQQRVVSTDMTVFLSGVMGAQGKITMLKTQDLTGADLATDGLQQGRGNGWPVRVSSGTIVGMALKQPQPLYPAMAKARHASGTVVLRAVIGTDGNVHDLSVVSSPDPDLATAAIAAVRQWKYKAYLFEGEPVEVETTINVNFSF